MAKKLTAHQKDVLIWMVDKLLARFDGNDDRWLKPSAHVGRNKVSEAAFRNLLELGYIERTGQSSGAIDYYAISTAGREYISEERFGI